MTNILVIDDEQVIINMLVSSLSSDSCRVQTAHNGQEGLRLLKSDTFDLVITDIIMPVLDGFEVIMAINRMPESPRIIVMTGGTLRLSREYLAEVAKTLNVQHVLYKPFSVDELLDTVFLPERSAEAAGRGIERGEGK